MRWNKRTGLVPNCHQNIEVTNLFHLIPDGAAMVVVAGKGTGSVGFAPKSSKLDEMPVFLAVLWVQRLFVVGRNATPKLLQRININYQRTTYNVLPTAPG